MPSKKIVKVIFIVLVFLTLLTPFLVFKELLYPFTTSKGFVFRILVQLALPFYLYLIVLDKSLRPNLKSYLNLSVLAFLAITLLSSFLSVNFQRSFWGDFERMSGAFFTLHLTLAYFYVLLLAKLSGNYFEKFLKAIVWISVALSLIGIVGFLGGPVLAPDSFLPARSSSMFGNPIFFASFLIFPLFLSAFFAVSSSEKKWKWSFWGAVLIQLIAVFVSGTRGAVLGITLGLIISAVLYVVFAKNKKIKIYGLALGLFFVIVASLMYTFPEKLPLGSTVRRVFTLQDSNTQARLILWKFSLKGFKDNPVLGVGPENFFEISNKYYKPEIRQYDSTWFDKPHNYLLEILLTTGILGFAAYSAIFISGVWILYLAYKREILTLLESALLLAGFSAYQFQNLFVFDTVSASMIFYLFLGFLGYLYIEAKTVQKNNNEKEENFSIQPSRFKPIYIFWPVLLVMLYAVYATNIVGLKASKNLNFVRAFYQKNFDVAKYYLDKMNNLPFNVYLRDWGKENADFAMWYSNLTPSSPKFEKAKQLIDESLKLQQRVVKVHQNDPGAWLKLGNVYFAKSLIEKTGFSQEAYNAGLKAERLVPKRTEARLFLVIISIKGDRLDLAEKWLNEMLIDYPNLTEAKWQLAHIYYFTDRQQQAEKLGEEALSENYKLRPITQGDWLLTFYYDNNMPEKAVEVLTGQLKGNEKNGDYFARLADAYNKAGRKVEARAAALKLLEIEPESKADVELFLQSLR